MKRIKVGFFGTMVRLALLCVFFSACSSSPAPVSGQTDTPQADAPQSAPKQDELDIAIRETSDYLNKQLTKKEEVGL